MVPVGRDSHEVGKTTGTFGMRIEILSQAEIEVPLFRAGVETGREYLEVGGFIKPRAGVALGGASFLEVHFDRAVGQGFAKHVLALDQNGLGASVGDGEVRLAVGLQLFASVDSGRGSEELFQVTFGDPAADGHFQACRRHCVCCAPSNASRCRESPRPARV